MHSTQGVYIARDNIFVEIPGKSEKNPAFVTEELENSILENY